MLITLKKCSFSLFSVLISGLQKTPTAIPKALYITLVVGIIFSLARSTKATLPTKPFLVHIAMTGSFHEFSPSFEIIVNTMKIEKSEIDFFLYNVYGRWPAASCYTVAM